MLEEGVSVGPVIAGLGTPLPICIETSVTRAPALDWVLRVKAPIGSALVSKATNWLDEPAKIVKAVGVELFGPERGWSGRRTLPK